MKRGKIILSIMATLLSIGGSLAFKTVKKFNGGQRIYVQTSGGQCLTCRSVWTNWRGSVLSSCLTVHNISFVAARNGKTFWKSIGPLKTCKSPVTKVSHNN